MSRARSLLSGAAWLYGAQLATMTAQIGYAAITSRAVDADGFGAYAVALLVSGFVSILANGGMAQTSSRLEDPTPSAMRPLNTYALVLGVIAALFVFLSADAWAWIWGNSEAAGPIRITTAIVVIAPGIGLLGGLLRRLGNFRRMATITLCANIAGMVIGAFFTVLYPGADSLLISPITAQWLILVCAVLTLRRKLGGFANPRLAGEHLSFSRRVVSLSVATYLVINISTFTVARFFGPATIGQWNRADSLTSVPIYQIQNALVQATYPEFRHDIGDNSRARTVWPDLLSLTAWGALPIGIVGAAVMPWFLPLVLGPGWNLAAALAAPLCIAASIHILCAMLAAAVEAVGKFRWVWIAQGCRATVLLGFSTAAILTQDVSIVAVGMSIALIVMYATLLAFASVSGYIDVKRLLTGHLYAVLGAAIVWVFCVWAEIAIASLSSSSWALAALMICFLVAAALVWRFRARLPPIRLARSYGLIK